MIKKLIKTFFESRDNQIVVVLVFLSLVLIIVGLVLLDGQEKEKGPVTIPNSVEEIVWKNETNNEFNFKIDYPEHFELIADTETLGPIFNFVEKGSYFINPLTHMDNESHFSIYPQGLPVQGSTFYYSERDFTNDKGVEFTLREFRMPSGEVWALMAIPKIEIKDWKSWGFVWISSKVKNEKYLCLSGGIEKDPDLCNPFEGDQITKTGTIDDKFIQIGREMLNTFESI